MMCGRTLLSDTDTESKQTSVKEDKLQLTVLVVHNMGDLNGVQLNYS